jgi:ABC-type uncharacterized transport system substrate-binding protein
MMRKIFWSGIILVIILFNTMPLFAHPHVFIDYQANFIFNQKGLSGVKLKWIFDEFYSASLLRDYDQKHDKSLSVSEVKRLQKEAFAAIANYNYFCDLRLNKKVFVIRSITDFNAAVENNRLIYVFFIPCQIIAKQNGQEIRLALYDSTYYISIALKNVNAVSITNPAKLRCALAIDEFSGELPEALQTMPEEIIIKFQK